MAKKQELCDKDNDLQRKGKHNSKEMKALHREYRKATEEDKELKALLRKYK